MNSWQVVGYNDSTGFRTELPVRFATREKAEQVREISRQLLPPSFRVVVEESTEEPNE
jgi:hypothetical protein